MGTVQHRTRISHEEKKKTRTTVCVFVLLAAVFLSRVRFFFCGFVSNLIAFSYVENVPTKKQQPVLRPNSASIGEKKIPAALYVTLGKFW